MTVKTRFTRHDFDRILSPYELGAFIRSEAIEQGTVQTNCFVDTTRGQFVLRYYENRSGESVRFESHLLAYLRQHHYPYPIPLPDTTGARVREKRKIDALTGLGRQAFFEELFESDALPKPRQPYE